MGSVTGDTMETEVEVALLSGPDGVASARGSALQAPALVKTRAKASTLASFPIKNVFDERPACGEIFILTVG
jgi:hypothetical protein